MARKAVSQHSENERRLDFVRRGATKPGRVAVAVLLDRAFGALPGSMGPEGGESSYLLYSQDRAKLKLPSASQLQVVERPMFESSIDGWDGRSSQSGYPARIGQGYKYLPVRLGHLDEASTKTDVVCSNPLQSSSNRAASVGNEFALHLPGLLPQTRSHSTPRQLAMAHTSYIHLPERWSKREGRAGTTREPLGPGGYWRDKKGETHRFRTGEEETNKSTISSTGSRRSPRIPLCADHQTTSLAFKTALAGSSILYPLPKCRNLKEEGGRS